MKRALIHVDVFTERAFFGNPLAVIVMESDPFALPTAPMQRIANWLNLSETTFAFANPDGSGYAVRIFTPTRELPFAGHPSIGTAAALFAAGKLSAQANEIGKGTNRNYIQRCGGGMLPVWHRDAHWFVQAPAATHKPLSDDACHALAQLCGLKLGPTKPMIVDNGPKWAVAEFCGTAELLASTPDLHALALWNQQHHNLGLAAFARGVDAGKPYLEVRCFVPLDGIPEDPVTGSGNAAIAAFLQAQGALHELGPSYAARQGRAIGRDGELLLHVTDAGAVHVGGKVQAIATGTLDWMDD
jgi:PhzF family phenazine biosynthesis protein